MPNPDDPQSRDREGSGDERSNLIPFPDRRQSPPPPDDSPGPEDDLQSGLTLTKASVQLTTDSPLDLMAIAERYHAAGTLLQASRQNVEEAMTMGEFHDPESMAAEALTTIKQRIETARSAAESLLMGELTGGLGAIDGSYQVEVLAVTLSLLADLSEDEHMVALMNFQLGHAGILDVLSLTSEKLEKVKENDFARLILTARENIGNRSTKEARLEKGRRVLRPIRLVR